jgi:ElaB/YqjD/DUF883 family membrane-anchored ribosome-binding protein
MSTTFPLIVTNDRKIAKDKLVGDLRTVVDDAEELLALTAAQAGEELADVRGRLHESVTKARERIEHLQADSAAMARSMASAAVQCVRESPWKSLGAAVATGALTGLLIGMLIGRR